MERDPRQTWRLATNLSEMALPLKLDLNIKTVNEPKSLKSLTLVLSMKLTWSNVIFPTLFNEIK